MTRPKGTVNVKQKDSANQTTNNATLNNDLAVSRLNILLCQKIILHEIYIRDVDRSNENLLPTMNVL
jgi:hypothetical protein